MIIPITGSVGGPGGSDFDLLEARDNRIKFMTSTVTPTNASATKLAIAVAEAGLMMAAGSWDRWI